jgi:hypothetical protein
VHSSIPVERLREGHGGTPGYSSPPCSMCSIMHTTVGKVGRITSAALSSGRRRWRWRLLASTCRDGWDGIIGIASPAQPSLRTCCQQPDPPPDARNQVGSIRSAIIIHPLREPHPIPSHPIPSGRRRRNTHQRFVLSHKYIPLVTLLT